jgi:hypothetical protein
MSNKIANVEAVSAINGVADLTLMKSASRGIPITASPKPIDDLINEPIKIIVIINRMVVVEIIKKKIGYCLDHI